MEKKARLTTCLAVGSAHGPRSSSWVITTDDHDIFVTTMMMRHSFKATLHESGQWHFKEFGPGTSSAPKLKSFATDAKAATRTTGLCVVIPDVCLRHASEPWNQHRVDIWLDRPEPNGFVELIVGRVTGPDTYELVPQHQKMGFHMWGMDMSDGWYAYFGYRALKATDAAGQQCQRVVDHVQKRLPAPQVLDSPERRAFVPLRTTQGHLMVLEMAID